MCHQVRLVSRLRWARVELPNTKQCLLDEQGVATRTDVSRHEVDAAAAAVVEEPVEPLLGCGREATASAAAAI